jgi:predicted phage-related endonuclease
MHYAIFHSIMVVPSHKGSNQQMSFSTLEEDMKSPLWRKCYEGRRSFIGGSDARIIMGSDEAALIRLWREKRGEAEPEDLSGNLIVQLGRATEELNRSWYERNTRPTGPRRAAQGHAFGNSLDGGHFGRRRGGK